MEATPEPPPLSAARQQRRIERARLHRQRQADEAMAAEATAAEATAAEATAASATVGAATATTAAAVSSGDMVCVWSAKGKASPTCARNGVPARCAGSVAERAVEDAAVEHIRSVVEPHRDRRRPHDDCIDRAFPRPGASGEDYMTVASTGLGPHSGVSGVGHMTVAATVLAGRVSSSSETS